MAITSTPYANLEQIRIYLSLASQDSQDDSVILDFARKASRAIDRYTRRHFYPKQETRFYDYRESKRIVLDDDLLAITTLNTQNGASQIANSILILKTGNNYNYSPYSELVINSSSGSALSYSGTTEKSNQISGIWGYHEDYGNAWLDTGTSLAASYSASGMSLNLAGAGSAGTGASDIEGNAPRISVGDLIRVGDQFFDIISGGSTNTLVNVKPYANGTTATSHPVGSSVTKFVFEPEIEYATRQLAVWQYAGRMTPFSVRSAFPALGEIQIPDTWNPIVKDKIERFKKPRITGY